MLLESLVLLATAGLAFGGGHGNGGKSVCNYYTRKAFGKSTLANQEKLITLIVNTAVIGNFTQPNEGIAVPGILNPNAKYRGRTVNLVPYFDGTLESSNVGGKPKSVNFLDGGGAAALKENKPAFNNSSNQYNLLTHLYEYFAQTLFCYTNHGRAFHKYAGSHSMYDVHRFMDLDHYQVNYFIDQIALAALSVGVGKGDVNSLQKQLNDGFNKRCAPKYQIAAQGGPQLQSICVARGCPRHRNHICSKYPTRFSEPPKPYKDLPAGAEKPHHM